MRWAAWTAVVLAVAPGAAVAQPVTVGVAAGPVRARQVRDRAPDSEIHDGFLAGAWIDVVTPVAGLSILAEAALVRRGAVYPLAGGAVRGQLDVDYLTLSVLPEVRFGVGPVAVLAYAGPSLDNHVRSAAPPELQPAFRDATAQVFGVAAGAGVGARAAGMVLRVEVRRHWALSAAFAGPADDVRHRSTEILLRVGRRAGA